MRHIFYIACITLVTACLTTPARLDECEDIFVTDEDIKSCAERVVRREDHRVKRELLKQVKAACRYPDQWLDWPQRCRKSDRRFGW